MKKLRGSNFAAKLGVLAALAISSILFSIPSAVNAEGTKTMAPYIGISPYKTTLEIEPGKTYTGSFRVSNVGEVDFNYAISVAPYSVTDENYTADFLTPSDYTRITEWITFEEGKTTGSLAPHTASDYISFTVTVPQNIPAGSQYAIIKATALNDPGEAVGYSIQNITSAGMILYANVKGGNTRPGAKIIENKIPTYLSSGPLNATSLVENYGNVYAEVKYNLEVTSVFGGDTVYSNIGDDEEVTTSIILPETKRFRTQTWQNVPFFGIFKVKQIIQVYDEYSEVEKIVIVCPIWLIIAVIVGLTALVIWIKVRSNARKKSGMSRNI
jgi:hypothetical protein